MKIWIDADASPKPVKEIVFRAAERLQLETVLVANHALRTPPSRFVRAVQVAAGFDVADNYLVQHAMPGDLAITADIPLAAELIDKQVQVIDPRGTLYTRDNIRERLVMRDFMEEMRGSGLAGGGPAAYSNSDKQAFANALVSLLRSSQHF
jgi:uncharacterized protein